ncbi:MAG TPA: acylphosphatase [Parasegetibacter sp.]
MLESIEIIIRGKVQGVFYRATANQVAARIGITGITRNQPDGTVYIIATGTTEQLEEFKDWCWEGSPDAVVSHVEVRKIPLQQFSDFRTIR